MGNVYLTEGKYEESIPYFQKALAIEPYFSTYSNLGTAYFFLKQYPNAVAMFEKAVALNPNDTMMVVNPADAYRYSNQQDRPRHVSAGDLGGIQRTADESKRCGNNGAGRALLREDR